MPGSRASFRRSSRMRAAVSGEWHRSVTGSRWARIAASVVPQAPAPTTATRAGASFEEAEPSAAAIRPSGRARSGSSTASCTRICSRNTSRIGVPSNPYASRSRFSR